MPQKDPLTYSVITYVWVIGLSVWGGAVSWVNKIKLGHVRAFNIMELAGELITSAFAGMLTFWLSEQAAFPPLVTAALIGVSGHMGSRAILALETYLMRRFGNT
jgi:hypothetical protein